MKAQRNDDVDNLEAVRNYFNQGGTIHALVDVSMDDLDVIYAYACQLFKSADYPAAKRYYMLLTNLCHWQYDYWLALGLCCQPSSALSKRHSSDSMIPSLSIWPGSVIG